MILHFLDSSNVGGIEAHVRTLAMAQRASGETVALLLWRSYSAGKSRLYFEKTPLPLLSADGSLTSLFRIIKRTRARILHTHGYKANILGRIAARSCGVAAVSTFHAGERAPFPVNLYQLADEWTSFLGKRIAVSEAIADVMPFATPFIPNFVELPPLEPRRFSRRNIAFAGRFSHEKGPDLFCEIAAALHDTFTFAAFGEGQMLESLRKSHHPDVSFKGFAHDMDTVWRDTDLLLMPSRNEGLPMAALEAMARGIPVAAASVGALPQVISHGVDGFLFPVGDVDAAKTCLKAWRDMSQNRKAAMSRAARSTVESRYSSAQGLREISRIYGRPPSIASKVQSSSGR